jgi:hypothetical protein
MSLYSSQRVEKCRFEGFQAPPGHSSSQEGGRLSRIDGCEDDMPSPRVRDLFLH